MTLVARQTFHSLWMLVSFALQLLRNLLLLPMILVRLVKFAVSHDGFEPDADMLHAHLLIPEADPADVPSDMARMEPALELAVARDWPALLDMLAQWENTRARTPTLSDMTTLAVEVLAEQAVALEQSGDEGYLADLEAAFAIHPTHHMLAALLAMTHIKLGWLWRGDGTADDIAPANEDHFAAHFARAADILAPFDAVTLDAPSVAVARYHLFACHPEAEDLIEDWFYDWVDLTPDAVSAFYGHGFQLLPQWFGADAGAIDRAGLHAMAATRDRLGAAAYPALWLAAFEGICEDGILEHMDVELFFVGLDDFMDRTGDARRANQITGQLYEMAFGVRAVAATSDAAKADEKITAALQIGYRRFVRRNLTALVGEMWNSLDDARWTVAQAYRDELEAGAVIAVQNGKIVVQMPAEHAP